MYPNSILSETEDNVWEVRIRQSLTFNFVDKGILTGMWKTVNLYPSKNVDQLVW